jgi:hypothetical protein
MATIYNITALEMSGFLRPEKGWKPEQQGNELVFSYHLVAHPFILIKVYSGMRTDTQESRGVGKDAIRVCAINTRTGQGWIKTKRVHRVEGWKANLKARVTKVIEQSKARLGVPH